MAKYVRLTMSAHSGQDEVRRPLSDDVANCPCNDDIIVLISVEIEVFFHSRDESVGDV